MALAPAVHSRQGAGAPSGPALAQRNIQDLARVITTEAGGENQAAQTAVGRALRNRMTRNGPDDVERVWSPAFQHRKHPTALATQLATGILNGLIADPTGGATHFYTPRIMPKKGEPTAHIDVAGGLETTPGVVDDEGRPIQNYRPSFSNWPQCIVAGVPEASFKFYRQQGDGHVR